MANHFGTDILIQGLIPRRPDFYVSYLGFEISSDNPKMICLHGPHINLFIEPGPSLGPVLEVTVDSVASAKPRLLDQGCEVVKDEPQFPDYERPIWLDLQLRTSMRVRVAVVMNCLDPEDWGQLNLNK